MGLLDLTLFILTTCTCKVLHLYQNLTSATRPFTLLIGWMSLQNLVHNTVQGQAALIGLSPIMQATLMQATQNYHYCVFGSMHNDTAQAHCVVV